MENKLIRRLIIVLLFIIVMLVVCLEMLPETYTKEVPCVDGDNRVNLEGFMCEEVVKEFMGVPTDYFMFLLLVIFFSLILAYFGFSE